jgi:hypothetical protein
MQELQARGDEQAKAWVETFRALGRQLAIKLP